MNPYIEILHKESGSEISIILANNDEYKINISSGDLTVQSLNGSLLIRPSSYNNVIIRLDS